MILFQVRQQANCNTSCHEIPFDDKFIQSNKIKIDQILNKSIHQTVNDPIILDTLSKNDIQELLFYENEPQFTVLYLLFSPLMMYIIGKYLSLCNLTLFCYYKIKLLKFDKAKKIF